MKAFNKFILLASGGTCAILLLLLYPITQYFADGVYEAVVVGSAVGLLNAAVAFFFNKKALVAEKNALLKIFFSGILLRLAFIALIFFIVATLSRLNLLAFAVAVIVSHLLLQLYEVRFLNTSLLRRKKVGNAA